MLITNHAVNIESNNNNHNSWWSKRVGVRASLYKFCISASIYDICIYIYIYIDDGKRLICVGDVFMHKLI